MLSYIGHTAAAQYEECLLNAFPGSCLLSRSVAQYPAAVKEFSWRNGFFWDISEKARKEGKEDPCPLHTKLLRQVADEQGLSL